MLLFIHTEVTLLVRGDLLLLYDGNLSRQALCFISVYLLAFVVVVIGLLRVVLRLEGDGRLVLVLLEEALFGEPLLYLGKRRLEISSLEAKLHPVEAIGLVLDLHQLETQIYQQLRIVLVIFLDEHY